MMRKVHTYRVELEIMDLKMIGNSALYNVKSNVSLPITCVLFDDKCKELSASRCIAKELAVQVLTGNTRSTHFSGLDLSKKYYSQCAISLGNNGETGVETIMCRVYQDGYSYN